MNTFYYVTSKNIPYQLLVASIEKDISKLRCSPCGQFCILETIERMDEFNPMTQSEIIEYLENNGWNE